MLESPNDEAALDALLRSGDAEVLGIFGDLYDAETGKWNLEGADETTLQNAWDGLYRYLAGKYEPLSGIGSAQTSADIRRQNAESIEALIGGKKLSELSSGSYTNKTLTGNLSKVFGAETLTMLESGQLNDTAALTYLRAMNSAYGTGFGASAYMSDADWRKVEDETIEKILSGDTANIPQEVLSDVSKRFDSSDWAQLTNTTLDTGVRRRVADRMKQQRDLRSTETKTDKQKFTQGKQVIENFKTLGANWWKDVSSTMQQEALQDTPVIQEILDAFATGITPTDAMYDEWIRQAEAAYRGLDLSQMYSASDMEAAADEFIDAFAGGQEAFQQYVDGHTDAYVSMMQSVVGINGMEAEYATSARRAAKVVELRSAQTQKKYGISSLQMTSSTKENDFVQTFFNKARAFQPDKFAAWYEHLSPEQKAILENDARTSGFLKTDAFAALLGVDNGISRDVALSQMQDYRNGISAPVSAADLADKASSLTSRFADATSENMETIFAEYDAQIATMKTESPLKAQQFEQTYGTLIEDYRNALAGGDNDQIKKAKQALDRAISDNKNSSKDWYPEYKQYIDGLTDLSEATRLETMFNLDDRRRQMSNAAYYAQRYLSGKYLNDEQLQYVSQNYNISMDQLQRN